MWSVNEALEEVVAQCRNVVDAHERRAEGYEGLTLNEGQEIGVLYVRLDDLAEARDAANRTARKQRPVAARDNT